MLARALLLSALIGSASVLCAQSQVSITHVQLLEKQGTWIGNNVTLPLGGKNEQEPATLYSEGDLSCMIVVKVNRKAEPGEGRMDDRVSLIFEIDMSSGRHKDNRRVEKVYRLNRTRTQRVSQNFTFSIAGRVRNITLVFDAEIS